MFKFGTLIDLKMFKMAEEVEDLAGAVKEAQIEQKLEQVDEDWSEQIFEFRKYKHKGDVILQMSTTGELIEKLEDAQMQLGSMATNRYSAPFKSKVNDWITKLSTVSEIVEMWLIVQNMYVYMGCVQRRRHCQAAPRRG